MAQGVASIRAVERPFYLYEVLEADGEIEVFDGLEQCARLLLGIPRGRREARLTSFELVQVDYRGAIRTKIETDQLRIDVTPNGDPNLRLGIVVRDLEHAHRRRMAAPTSVEVPLSGDLMRMNATLRWRDEIICEARWDRLEEQALFQLDPHWRRSASAPVGLDEQAGSTVADLVLGFMKDGRLAVMVSRDLNELDAAVHGAANKAAVLIIGSILEAALLDVLGRNEAEALKRLRNKWPDRASLKDLIDVACSVLVVSPDGSPVPLLPPLTGKKGWVVTEHRDLIHPRAEVRGAAVVDGNTVTTMRGVLGEIVRDLQRAHDSGILAEYEAGRIA